MIATCLEQCHAFEDNAFSLQWCDIDKTFAFKGFHVCFILCEKRRAFRYELDCSFIKVIKMQMGGNYRIDI